MDRPSNTLLNQPPTITTMVMTKPMPPKTMQMTLTTNNTSDDIDQYLVNHPTIFMTPPNPQLL